MDHVWELQELIQERNMIYVKSVLAGVAALLVVRLFPSRGAVTTGGPISLGPEISASPLLLTQTQIY